MNSQIKVITIHMIRNQYQLLTLRLLASKLSIINATHQVAKAIHNRTTKTKIIVSQAAGKQINNNQSKVERIEEIPIKALFSIHGYLIEKAIPIIQKIKAQIAKIATIVDKPKLGIVNKQHQKIR